MSSRFAALLFASLTIAIAPLSACGARSDLLFPVPEAGSVDLDAEPPQGPGPDARPPTPTPPGSGLRDSGPDAFDATLDAGTDAPADAPVLWFDADVPLDGSVAAALVLFGGVDTTFCPDAGGNCDGAVLGDTWIWSQGTWTRTNVPAPPPREGHMMASWGGTALLFGGFSAANPLTALADTWQWDGTTWTELPVPGPPARAYAAMGELNGKVVLVGGSDALDRALGDTWVWDGASWTEQKVTGPSARVMSAMSRLGGRLILEGGYDNEGHVFADTWAWDGAAWTQLDVIGPEEEEHGMATLGSEIVLYGSIFAVLNGQAFGGTAIWDGTNWAPLSAPGPSPRQNPAMAATGQEAILFGGISVGGVAAETLADTWSWDGVAWTQRNVTGPGPRWLSAMASFDLPAPAADR